MRKYIIILLIIFALASLNAATAGNNTTIVDNPTTVYIASNQTVTALESGDSNISFSDGYKGYCIEWGEHSAEENDTYSVVDTSNAINKETNDDISNYLKVMFLFFYNKTQENPIVTQHMIWKFTNNKQFSKFDKDWYNDIIDTADKFKIGDYGTIPINDTHEFVYEFKVFIPKFLEYQSYFGYKFYVQKIKTNSSVNVSGQIINSSINYLDTYLITNHSNDTTFQYNGTYIIKQEEKIVQSISDRTLLQKNVTGFKFDWMILCIIILLITCLITYRD